MWEESYSILLRFVMWKLSRKVCNFEKSSLLFVGSNLYLCKCWNWFQFTFDSWNKMLAGNARNLCSKHFQMAASICMYSEYCFEYKSPDVSLSLYNSMWAVWTLDVYSENVSLSIAYEVSTSYNQFSSSALHHYIEASRVETDFSIWKFGSNKIEKTISFL